MNKHAIILKILQSISLIIFYNIVMNLCKLTLRSLFFVKEMFADVIV